MESPTQPDIPVSATGTTPADYSQASGVLSGTGANFQSAADAATNAPAATAPVVGPPAPGQAPPSQADQQAQAQHQASLPENKVKPSVLSDILHAVAAVLGGPSSVKQVDPATGNIVDQPLTRAQRIANTASIYMRAAAAGAGQTGPGHIGKAALAGAQAQQQFQQQQTENLTEQQKLTQQALMNRASIAMQNNQTLLAWNKYYLEDKEFRQAVDASDLVFSLKMQDAGATAVPMIVGGKNVNGTSDEDGIKAWWSAHKTPPQGYDYVPTRKIDSKGNEIYTVLQLPHNRMNDRVDLPVEDAKALGIPIPTTAGETVGLTVGDIVASRSLHLKDLNEQSETHKNWMQAQEAQAGAKQKNADANLADTQARALLGAQQADPFGNTSTLPQKELLKRQDGFQKDTVNKAYDVEKAYTMSQQAFSEYRAAAMQGKELPTGAQSMLLLSQHLGTTFGNVKGSRITKDMIAEHLGARGITDDAVTAVQRLVNGDQLSAGQWSAFTDLIGQSRNATWSNAISSAKNQQLPITFLPRGNGKTPIDKNTAQLYLTAADNDPVKARTAAQKQGWVTAQ